MTSAIIAAGNSLTALVPAAEWAEMAAVSTPQEWSNSYLLVRLVAGGQGIMSQTRHMGMRKRGRVRLVPPVMAAHGQRNLRFATETLPAHIETHGALALLDVEQLDTQPVPALRSVIARRHILIVEDDSRMASVIQAALELEGEASWLVQSASGGKHALELASATPPDVVLLDVLLPDLDGAEVYHRLRANAQTHASRILFLSAGTSFDLFQRGIEDGVLLRKPFPMPELVSLVRALLRG